MNAKGRPAAPSAPRAATRAPAPPPAPARGPAPAAAPDPDVAPQPNVLREHTAALVSLLARLRDATPADPAALRRNLAASITRFEAGARAAAINEPTVAAASYLLCVWADELFAASPWGTPGAGLLEQFHGESAGADKLLRLLARLAEKPREHRELLELFHAALSLGLRLRSASMDAAAQETLRTRLHLALEQAAPAPALAPAWQCADAAARPPRAPRLALPMVLMLGVLAFGVYSASQLQLARRVDGVLDSLQRLVPPRAPAADLAAPSAAPVPPRLATRLADDVAAGRVKVRDEALRSVVVIGVDGLADARPVIGRVGAALAAVPGQVLVVGYTDGSDAPTARLPSAWHQAMEWARTTADGLRPALGDERMAVEARVDAAAPEPRRRVEIVVFPQ